MLHVSLKEGKFYIYDRNLMTHNYNLNVCIFIKIVLNNYFKKLKYKKKIIFQGYLSL